MEFLSSITQGPNRTLALQAYDGWNIPNSTDEEVSQGYIALARQSDKMRVAIAASTSLAPPTGRYNCHGLVFGSRRANIPPANMPHAVNIETLLQKDQYRRIVFPPRVGDVVVYRIGKEICHTGIVSSVQRLSDQSSVPIIFVWSKWGAEGEFEHREYSCPYEAETEYWRLMR